MTAKVFKAYIVIYTFAACSNVILEVVPDSKADSFISSFKRFISRRRCPNAVVSDNGSVLKAEETQAFMANYYVEWRFNLEVAPWWGGLWL